MPVVKVLINRNAQALDRYLETEKDGVDGPRVLFVDTRHCVREMAVAEFRSTRERYGTAGAERASKAHFERVDQHTGLTEDGEPGTHVLRYTGGRWRKMPVRAGETPTHRRVEATGAVRQSEVTHTIYAFGLDEVNPDDPDAVERAVDAVFAERRANYPGLQEKLVAQADSGKLHVHIMSNATVYEAFTVGERTFRPGQKMAGVLTDIHAIRRRADEFYDRHPEYGIDQHLARVGTAAYEAAQIRSGQRDYHDRRRAQDQGTQPVESNHARIRRLTYEALPQGDGSLDAFQAGSAAAGVEVKEVGLRRGIPTKSHDLSYRLDGSASWVRGRTLGPEWTYDGVTANLERLAQGQPIVPPRGRQQAGPPKPLPVLSPEERIELQAAVDAYAAQERARQRQEAAAARAAARPVVPHHPDAGSAATWVRT